MTNQCNEEGLQPTQLGTYTCEQTDKHMRTPKNAVFFDHQHGSSGIVQLLIQYVTGQMRYKLPSERMRGQIRVFPPPNRVRFWLLFFRCHNRNFTHNCFHSVPNFPNWCSSSLWLITPGSVQPTEAAQTDLRGEHSRRANNRCEPSPEQPPQ